MDVFGAKPYSRVGLAQSRNAGLDPIQGRSSPECERFSMIDYSKANP